MTRLRSFLAAALLAVLTILAVPLAAHAQPFAYVPNQFDHDVSVIDVSSGLVVGTPVDVFFNQPQMVAINRDGSRVYVAHPGSSGIISVIESTTNTVITRFLLGPPFNTFGGVQGMAIDDASGTSARLFVATDDGTHHKLAVLDAKTGTVLGSADVGANPYAVAYSPASHEVFVTHLTGSAGADTVDVVDVSGASPTTKSGVGYPIPIADTPTGIAVSPLGDRIYVASAGGFAGAGTLSVISTATNLVTATTSGPPNGAHDVAVNPATGHVYVTSPGGSDIDEFGADGTAIGVFATVPGDSGTGARVTQGIAVSPDGLSLLVVNSILEEVDKYPIATTSSSDTGTPIAVSHIFSGGLIARGNFIGPAVIHYTPGPPKNVTASLTGIQGQVQLDFVAPDPTPSNNPLVSTYTYTVMDFNTQVATTPNTSILLTGLANGQGHQFTVFATNTYGDGPLSAASGSVTPLATVPDAPTGVSAVAGLAGHATISFTPPANDGGAAGGILQYHVVSSPGGFDYFGTSSPIGASGLTNGTAYTFTVAAINSVAEGAASSASNAVTPTDVPAAPLLTGTTVDDHQVTVTFDPPAGDNGLPVTSYTAIAQPGHITATGASSPITVTGLTNLTDYTLTVTANNADGASIESNPVTAKPFQRPAAPTGLVASVDAIGGVKIDCTNPSSAGDAPGGITSYTAFSSPGGFNTSNLSGCPFSFSGLTVGTSYTFTAVANTSLGPSAASAPSNAVVAATTAGAPTGVIATAIGPTSASISFTPPASDGGSPITFYNIRASPPLTTTLSTVSSPGLVTGLSPSVSYTFTVSAFNAAGEGPQSAASNSIVTVVSPPSGVHALGGDASVTVTFATPPAAPPSPVTSYTATSSPGGITGSSTSRPVVRVTGLTNGTAYTFTVTTHHADGSSETSTASNSVTPAKLPARTSPWAYVASELDGLVAVIDTSTDTVINTIDLGQFSGPSGVAASPDGKRVYVAIVGAVAVIDTATQAVIGTITIPDDPLLVAVDPSSAHAYAANSFGANSVSVIDTSSDTVTGTIPLPDQPFGIAVDPTGASVYVSLPNLGQVLRIDAATKAIAATSPALAIAPTGLAAVAGDVLYACDAGGGQLATMTASALAIQSTTSLATLPGEGSFTVAVDPQSGHAFFVRGVPGSPGTVSQLDGPSVLAGTGATSISITPTGGKIYVTNITDNTVSVIDSASMTVTGTIPVGRLPLSLGRFISPGDSNPPRLGNISTRGSVLTGFNVMIGGFVIGGSTPKTVVIRAIGPSLANFGVTGVLANPTMQLVRQSDGATIASNDDWQGAANAADVLASGFAPTNAHESAILMTLDPGAYTAVVSGVNNTTGVGLVEVYEVDHTEIPLVNISTRGRVGTGGSVMIGGFVVQGDGPRTVVIRATGPSLANFGVTGALQNPTMSLVRLSDNATIAVNDDWQSAANAADILANGFAPSNPHESAILMTLDPGAYTAVVSGVNNTTGIGLVEVYTIAP